MSQPNLQNFQINLSFNDLNDVNILSPADNDVLAYNSISGNWEIGTAGGGIGINQTWQNVLASRSSGVTYTNNTGRTIVITISRGMAANSYHSVSIDGNEVSRFVNPFGDRPVYVGITHIVPNGSTYITTGGGGVTFWWELR